MKKLLASLALASSAVLCALPASAAIVVTVSPSSQHVNVGDTVTINVSISGLGTEILSAIDLDMLFNSGVLGDPRSIAIVDTEFGATPADSFFDVFFGLGDSEIRGGSLLLDDDLAAIQTDGGFQFLSYSFKALADGFSFLNYGPDLDFQRNFTGRNAAMLAVTVQGACVSVGQVTDCSRVPEPTSISLAGLALLGVFATGALRRRRQPTSA